jgi:CheY-like chemotaxis protein
VPIAARGYRKWEGTRRGRFGRWLVIARAGVRVLADEVDPDVILMDISMPVMDGFDAARSIRGTHPNMCILFLTGSNAPTDIAAARDAGGSGYVTKDRIASELIDAIRAAAPARG